MKEDAIYEDGGGRMAEGRTARGGEPGGRTTGGPRLAVVAAAAAAAAAAGLKQATACRPNT